MGVTEKRKGTVFEREIAARFREIDPSAKRALEFQGGLGYDIHLDNLPLLIQCKTGARPNPIAAFLEAEAAKKKDPRLSERIPVSICRKKYTGDFVTTSLDDFLFLIRRAFVPPL